ncbi:MAG: InlB B-repeat-containing protein, partial [Acetatifactor sp.]
ALEKEGYTFTGWYEDETCTKSYDFYTAVTENLTIYAGWELNVYTVTLDAAGGIMTIDGAAGLQKASLNVNHGETAALPEPEQTGYTFVGWYEIDASDPANVIETEYTSKSVITGDLNLTAKWEINLYLVTFEHGNGEEPTVTEVEYLQTATEPDLALEKEGYTFTGWYEDETCKVPYDFEKAVTENLTIYAGWELNVYTVSLDAAGGIMTIDGAEGLKEASLNVNHGETAALPEPEQTGYTFLGWYEIDASNPDAVIETEYTSKSVITGDLNLTAKWEIKRYTVTLDPQNGENAMAMYLEHGSVVMMPEGWPTLSDSCDLEGWYYEDTYETAYVEEEVTKDLTLYAKWVCNVELNLGPGYVELDGEMLEGSVVISVPVGETPELPNPMVDSEGYIFEGWYLDEAYEQPYEEGPVSEHMTLYSKWTVVEL